MGPFIDATEKGAVYLSVATDAVIARPMGRPPLNHVRVPIRLPQEAIDEIDAMVGTYGRAGFIREAVERELKRRKN